MAFLRDRQRQSVPSLLLAASAFAAGVVGTAAAGVSEDAIADRSVSVAGAQLAHGVSIDAALERIADLLTENRAVRAKALLGELTGSADAVGMSDEQVRRSFSLLRRANEAVRGLDRLDVSLQKAELGLLTDDLKEAERQARAVRSHPKATASQGAAAATLLGLVADRRDDLAGDIAGRLDRAVAAFETGRYGEAKAALTMLRRSGVDLSGDQRATIADYAGRVADLEIAAGRTFDSPALTMSMLNQPSAVQSGDWIIGSGAMNVQPDASDEDIVAMAQRLEAQRLLAEADQAFDARQMNEAARKYAQLNSNFYRGYLSEEEITRVEENLAEARLSGGRAAAAAPSGPGGLLDTQVGDRDLARQQITTELEALLAQAEMALESGDIEQARQLQAEAGLRLSRGREVFDETRYEQLDADVSAMRQRIESAAAAAATDEAERLSRDIAEQQAEAQAERSQEKNQKIAELLARIRALQLEGNYEKALQEVEQLLFIDPNNPAGQLLYDVLRDTMIFREYNDTHEEIHRGVARTTTENYSALIPPEGILNYPKDWVDISNRRGDPMQFSESAVNRAVLATLANTRLPVDFQDVAFEDVLTFVSQYANLEMDVDWQSLEDINVDPADPISMNLTNVPLETVLNKALEKASDPDIPAGWAVRDGILTIASDEVLRRNTVLEIYDIRDLIIEVPNFDNAPEFDLNQVFQQGGQSGGGGGGTSPFQQQGQDDIDRIPYEDLVQRLVDIIQANVDPDGWEDFGGETGTIEEYNGNLIVTNTPRNHRQITTLLGRLREVRNMQINVEGRFLLVREEFFEQIGFDLDVYFGGNSNEFRTAQLIDPTLALSDYFQTGGTGLLENVSGNGGFDADGNGIIDTQERTIQPRFEPGTQGDDFSPISGAQNSLDLVEALGAGTDFASQVLSISPALGIAGRFMDDIQVDFLVKATQADRRSLTLTAPRLTFTNGQRAFVTVATQLSFVSDLVPVVSDSSAAFDPTVSVVSNGVVLDIDGVISADRRYVTLNVDTRVSAVEFAEDSEVSAVAGGTGGSAGGGTISAAIQLPTITITQVQTTVTVPDQGTILLGGQRIVDEFTTETGVPVLSKIPILNRFFSNRLETKEERTLLVLLKPTILIQNEEEERNFPGLLDSLGR